LFFDTIVVLVSCSRMVWVCLHVLHTSKKNYAFELTKIINYIVSVDWTTRYLVTNKT